MRGVYSIQLVDGENALVMEPELRCVSMNAMTNVGIPSGTEAWAFRYKEYLDNSARSTMTVGSSQSDFGLRIGRLGDGMSRIRTVCLPRWMNGTYQRVNYALPGQSGLCSAPSSWRTVLDNVEVINLPECGEMGILRDGGFDEPNASPWIVNQQLFSATVEFQTVNGNRFVRMNAGECDRPSVQQSFLIPDSPTAPNAIEFRYRHSEIQGTSPRARLGSETLSLGDTAGAWRTEQICIKPEQYGFPLNFTAEMSSNGLCAPGNPIPVTFDVDDVQLITTTACEP
jgi:hypothetical protein